jgi:NADPH:quinone reductase-like Zn-dependent oxidoreductase
MTPARVRQIWRRRDPRIVEHIVSLLAAGEQSWDVSRIYAFDQARAAYKAIFARNVRGKSVLTS